MTLTWESTYAIALELRRQHPDIDFEEITLGQIYKWTLQLNEFEDDPRSQTTTSFTQSIKTGSRRL